LRPATAHLEKAHRTLASGRYLLAGGFPDHAGRDAYMAAFHAALAFIVARTGKEPKTHNGTHTEFARLVREEPGIGHAFVAFLSRSYELKSFADYDDGDPVTAAEAQASLEFAHRFVEVIAGVIVTQP
jgi:uncharacterized protein (UPF0332 family)